LRGRAREFDHEGVCGAQKLVLTGDLIRLMEHFHRLFPGAKRPTCEEGADPHDDRLTQLVRALMAPELPDIIPAKQIGTVLGVEWREVVGGLKRHQSWDTILPTMGWQYVPKPGRPKAGEVGSHFARIRGREEVLEEHHRPTQPAPQKIDATEL
jgi:hypothetical protein